MDDLIARLRKGAVYGDPRNIGSSGEYDEAATDALLNTAATALEDAYAKIDAQRQELDLLRPAYFGDPSNDRREDGLYEALVERWKRWRIADELVNSGNAPASPRSNEELDQILLKAAELIRTGARQ